VRLNRSVPTDTNVGLVVLIHSCWTQGATSNDKGLWQGLTRRPTVASPSIHLPAKPRTGTANSNLCNFSRPSNQRSGEDSARRGRRAWKLGLPTRTATATSALPCREPGPQVVVGGWETSPKTRIRSASSDCGGRWPESPAEYPGFATTSEPSLPRGVGCTALPTHHYSSGRGSSHG
jgi:hypothetical protein